ncbi:terminase gpA endonuclease subunit, partial [Hyphococcus sp.]|uniref:terminase gpA endonuclease subunit n=1 Tax=Hyphococcus sp. TaxID=2038636 RepID=UPI003753242A
MSALAEAQKRKSNRTRARPPDLLMLRDRFPDLAIGAAIVFAAAANASTPPEDIPVDEWAGRFRYVAAESGSAHPGLWNNRLTPYAVKPMRVMSPSHPARRVAVSGSAQTLKSELMLNAIFTMIATAPANSMMVLPSIDEVGNWNRTKWRPNVKVTPAVNDRVIPERSRDENASTGAIKEYLGGKLFIVTAGSSKGLQAKSIKNLYFDEISEFPEDTKDRGDPIDQARHRQDGQGDETKELAASTPKELPNCRITKMVASGTLEKYYIACPHCGHYQQLTFDNFQAEELAPWFICAANGCVIEETRKHGFLQYGYHGGKLHPSWRRREPLVAEVRRAERELESFLVDRELERKDRAEGFDVSTGPAEEINLQISKARYQLNAIKRELDDLDDAVAAILPGAEWLATFQSEDPDNPPPPEHFPPEELGRWLNRDTEGREPSFHIWQAYSTLKPWSKIAVEWREADGDPIKKKTFCQQVLAEAYEATGEAPDHEKLYNRRSENYALGGVPFGYWILTGAADIQSDRIEACVWAWGPGWSSFLVAREVFKGKPQNEHDDCWKKLGEFRMRTFEGENGFQFPITLFAVDAGYATYDVYRFCNGRANTL